MWETQVRLDSQGHQVDTQKVTYPSWILADDGVGDSDYNLSKKQMETKNIFAWR